jgi:hypothetical protein
MTCSDRIGGRDTTAVVADAVFATVSGDTKAGTIGHYGRRSRCAAGIVTCIADTATPTRIILQLSIVGRIVLLPSLRGRAADTMACAGPAAMDAGGRPTKWLCRPIWQNRTSSTYRRSFARNERAKSIQVYLWREVGCPARDMQTLKGTWGLASRSGAL